MSLHNYTTAAIDLLKELIAIQSFSREENATADSIAAFFQSNGIACHRSKNNIWASNRFYSPAKPTLLLNSHHDTVNPNPGYTRNPLEPAVEDGKLYGLGSNDAGGALVSLLAAFLYFYESEDLSFNLVYAATAEEEISGKDGIESIIPELGTIDMAIVGEPTGMQMAVAERGLMVLDCVATGKTGHAANAGGINAIYLAMKDIEWFRTYTFEKQSDWLGAVGMNVTVINAGQAHNQVPAECRFVVDVRLNEHYSHQRALEIIKQHVASEVKERSMRIKPSFIDGAHAMVQAAQQLGITLFGSSTTSDMALMPWPAVKIGPGISARSHSADEFIYLNEIEEGIKTYIELIELYSAKTSA